MSNHSESHDEMFPDDMTLGEAREKLRELVDEGYPCPLCKQLAKVYRRKINKTMAKALVKLYRAGGDRAFVHAPSLPGDTHEMSQFAFWGLIVEESERREDGGRAGWWMLTGAGVSFVLDQAKVPKYARIYDHRVLNHVGDHVSIIDCLGSPFHYRELMEGI